MADPRNTVGFEGIGENFATFKIDGSTITYDATQTGGAAATMIGKAVSLSADGTVQLAADGDAIIGKLTLVEPDLKANVQIHGCTGFPGGNAATLTLGTKIVGALGAASARGYIRSVNTAVAAETGKAKGQIYDASDTTNVQVDLG